MEEVMPGHHIIPLNAESNEVVYDGESGDVAALTANIVGLLGVYYDDNGVWKYYIPGFATQTLTTLEHGKTYLIVVSTYPQDWLVPDHFAAPPPPAEGTYLVSIYYAHAPSDPLPSDWQPLITYLVEYETELLVNFIKQQGYAAYMPTMAVELIELPEDYMWDYQIKEMIKNRPSYQDTDIHIIIGSSSSGCNAHQFRDIVFAYFAGLEMDVYSMEGRGGRYNQCYSVLAHEIGHMFHLQHCSNKPCPMASTPVSYSEWVTMGRTIRFCSYHQAQLLPNWKNRDYEH